VRQADAQIVSTPADEPLRYASEKTGSITAGPVGINSAAMREPLQRDQSTVDNFMRRRLAEVDDKAGATSVVIGMAVKGPVGHAPCLINKYGQKGKFRISMHGI
jgi:hypothetical protein